MIELQLQEKITRDFYSWFSGSNKALRMCGFPNITNNNGYTTVVAFSEISNTISLNAAYIGTTDVANSSLMCISFR